MALPFSSEGLITEPANWPQSLWPRDRDNILPFLVALQQLKWELLQLSADAPMFVDLPHTENSIYTNFSMSISLPPNYEISGACGLARFAEAYRDKGQSVRCIGLLGVVCISIKALSFPVRGAGTGGLMTPARQAFYRVCSCLNARDTHVAIVRDPLVAGSGRSSRC